MSAEIAQLVERRTENSGVDSSSLSLGTIIKQIPENMRDSVFEKRRNFRVNTIIKINIFNYYSGKFLGTGYITDVSIGGLRVESIKNISDDDDVLVKFILNNFQYFENIRGRIIRTGKESFTYFYGIKFMDVSFRDRVRLWFYSRKIEKSYKS